MRIEEISASEAVWRWLKQRYGKNSDEIWRAVCGHYSEYLSESPNYGGKKNGHAIAIYGGLLIFALYASLPDSPPIEELEGFVCELFMSRFTTLGRFFDLNRKTDMRLINAVFNKVGRRDRKDYRQWADGFITVNEPYDGEHHAARYHFDQCPNAEFAKSHKMLHVLPLLCNGDFYGISQLHGRLIRCGTCGNSSCCDYCVVGDKNPLAANYEEKRDRYGFIVSVQREREKKE